MKTVIPGGSVARQWQERAVELGDEVSALRAQLEVADAEIHRLSELVQETQVNYELYIDLNRQLRAERTALLLVLRQIDDDDEWRLCSDSCVEFARPLIKNLVTDTLPEPF